MQVLLLGVFFVTKLQDKKMLYTEVTDGIRVSVSPEFSEEQSSPYDHFFVWKYRVVIENISKRKVQLINRFWRIVDENGFVQRVEGQGVVGVQPILMPGENFAYTSRANLNTPSGMMFGMYEFEADNKRLQIMIPAFSLDSAHRKVLVN